MTEFDNYVLHHDQGDPATFVMLLAFGLLFLSMYVIFYIGLYQLKTEREFMKRHPEEYALYRRQQDQMELNILAGLGFGITFAAIINSIK